MKKITLLIISLLFNTAYAANDLSFDSLLKQAKQGRAEDHGINAKRMQVFKENKAEQKKLLAQVKKALVKEQKHSKELDKSFTNNDLKLIKLSAELKQKQGRLKELLGGVQQLTGDTLGQLEESIISAQFPERIIRLQELNKSMADGTTSISMADIRQVWFEVLREMIESGNVTNFEASVTDATGIQTQQMVSRFGTFNIATTGNTPGYLHYSSDQGGSLSELARQPSGAYMGMLEDFNYQENGSIQTIGIDPTRGQLLKALMQEPDLVERFHQGGLVGYLIAVLGLVALIISVFKISVIFTIKQRFTRQLKDLGNINLNNALGRVLNVQKQSEEVDLESLELKLSEAIYRETPALTKYHSVLKIIAVIAPLMGLLGTVVGMIITFQSITLYGTGDPKLMAGGISSALVTTVLGLIVAIPTLFSHNYLSEQSKALVQILEEQAMGRLAQQVGNK